LKRALWLWLLCAGCYRLSDLESSTTSSSITMVGTPQTSESGEVSIPTGVENGDTLLLTLHNYPASSTVPGWTSEQFLATQCNDSLFAWRRIADGTEGSTLQLDEIESSDVVLVAYRGVSSTGNLRTAAYAETLMGAFDAPIGGASGDVVVIRVLTDDGDGAIWSASAGFKLRAQTGSVAVFDGTLSDPVPNAITLIPSLGRCPVAISESLTPN
jgi:hypothetical protein